MKILIVDDDHLEVNRIAEFFKKHMDAQIESISTESEFVRRLDEIRGMKLNVIIMDIMLRWANPGPDLDPTKVPPEVLEEGFYTAGIRCLKRLKARSDTSDVPVILYSALDQKDFKYEHVVHTKSDELAPLLAAVRERVQTPEHP